MVDILPHDDLSTALTKTPLVRYLNVPLTYSIIIAISTMTPFFTGMFLKADYLYVLFMALSSGGIVWSIGAEITRKDDRQLEIIWHYFLTRGVLNAFYRLTRLGKRNAFYKGEWCDL